MHTLNLQKETFSCNLSLVSYNNVRLLRLDKKHFTSKRPKPEPTAIWIIALLWYLNGTRLQTNVLRSTPVSFTDPVGTACFNAPVFYNIVSRHLYFIQTTPHCSLQCTL